MGKSLKIEWHESADYLKQNYQQERHIQRRTRLHALWHLRQGKSLKTVAEIVGVPYRVLQRWVAWYRQGGLEEVLRRVTGHHVQGVAPYLTPLQQKALAAKVERGEFRTVWDVIQWVEDRWGIRYSNKGMYSLLARHHLRLKVPRPHSEKASEQQQIDWKKGA